MERNNLLEVEHLSVHIPSTAGTVQAVRDVSFAVAPGEVLALVGESGCGKSILCKSVMKLLPKRASIVSGTIRADGRDITRCSEREMRNLRGTLFSMVFQDPLTALNPTIPIGKQIAEAVTIHQKGLSKAQVQERVIELMTLVGIAHPLERAKFYPYHFSGGMRQRCVRAMALAGRPKILFADEPTTSLDVTIQAQILDLLRDIQRKLDTATVFVSHDLGVVARVADRVAVMYAGKIVEIGTAEEIFYDPRHPYTWALLRALPAFAKGKERLCTIPGTPPTLDDVETDPGTGLVPLGDMVLSLERAEAQGAEYGHGAEREAAYLAVHSVLHLLGYDHLDEGPMKAQMREREEAILAALGITREGADG